MKLYMLTAHIMPFHTKAKILHSGTHIKGVVTFNVHMSKSRILLGPYSEYIK